MWQVEHSQMYRYYAYWTYRTWEREKKEIMNIIYKLIEIQDNFHGLEFYTNDPPRKDVIPWFQGENVVSFFLSPMIRLT